MPVSLNKLRELQDKALQVKPDEPSVYKRPKKNSPAYWQVVVMGKPLGPLFTTQEKAEVFIKEQMLYDKLPAIERISIDEFNRKRDHKTAERS